MSKYSNVIVHKYEYGNEKKEMFWISGAFLNKKPEGESIMVGKNDNIFIDNFIITDHKTYKND